MVPRQERQLERSRSLRTLAPACAAVSAQCGRASLLARAGASGPTARTSGTTRKPRTFRMARGKGYSARRTGRRQTLKATAYPGDQPRDLNDAGLLAVALARL